MEVFEQNPLSPEELEERFKILQFKVFEHKIEIVWKQFEDAGFTPILIKGWAAAQQFYPKPYQRHFVDVDLIIEPKLFDKAVEFSKGLKTDLIVDLHKGARHLDSLIFEELYRNSNQIKCGETFVRVPRPEDHLRILCVHWLNDGGAEKEKLWDIYNAIENRSENFEWDRFLNVVSQKRRQWLISTLGIAHRYLGLELRNTPVENEAQNIPQWLIKALEKEWASDVKLLPLHYFLKDKKMLWKQIKKRIPPNPIQATIEVEGNFDDKSRIKYQLLDILIRVVPAIKRINKTFKTS